MNERIREIMRQTCREAARPESVLEDVPQDILEKFALSIVKECENVAKNPKWYSESPSNGWRNPIRLVCRAMKEHFGIEE